MIYEIYYLNSKVSAQEWKTIVIAPDLHGFTAEWTPERYGGIQLHPLMSSGPVVTVKPYTLLNF